MPKDFQFVTDAAGHRTAVLLPIEQFEAFEEYLIDVGMGKAAREALTDEERIPWEQVQAELIAEGKLDA